MTMRNNSCFHIWKILEFFLVVLVLSALSACVPGTIEATILPAPTASATATEIPAPTATAPLELSTPTQRAPEIFMFSEEREPAVGEAGEVCVAVQDFGSQPVPDVIVPIRELGEPDVDVFLLISTDSAEVCVDPLIPGQYTISAFHEPDDEDLVEVYFFEVFGAETIHFVFREVP